MIINLGDAPFKAFIKVTYPNGTCIVSLGDKSFTHTGGGTHTFTVNRKGTWTVTCISNDGYNTKATSTAALTYRGQVASVTLSYILYLYYRGNLQVENSNGWGYSSTNVEFNADHIRLPGQFDHRVFVHSRAIPPSGYSKLVVVGEVEQHTNYICFENCGLVSKSDLHNGDVAAVWHYGSPGAFTKTIDISSVSDLKQRVVKISVGLSFLCVGKIYEVYLKS